MTKTGQNELELMGRYRLEASAIDRRITDLTARRKTIEAAINGLRDLLRNSGVDDAVIDAEPDPGLADTAGTRRRLTTIDHAVNVLAHEPRDLGVMEIQKAIRPRHSIAYWALSKALNREAARPNGRIVKVGSAFRVRSQ